MSIFSPQEEQATRERVSGQAIGFKPTGFSENARAAWNEFQNNDRFGAIQDNRRKAYADVIRTAENITGNKLVNPIKAPLPFSTGQSFKDRLDPKKLSSFDKRVLDIVPDIKNPLEVVYDLFRDDPGNLPEHSRLKEFEKQIQKLRERFPNSHPGRDHPILDRSQIEKKLQEKAKKLELDNADIASRATALGVVGQFAGMGGAAIVQPEVLVTLPIGAPLRASILTRILVEGGVGAVSEAALQPTVQNQRDQLGLESGVGRALQNIAGAGFGSAVLTGGFIGIGAVLKGGVRAFERAVGRTATKTEKALVEQIIRDAQVERQSPYKEVTPKAQATQLHNENVGYEAALALRPIDDADLTSDIDLTPKADVELDRAIREGSTLQILRNDDLDTIGVDATLMQFKSGGDATGVTDRLLGVKEWSVERAGVSLVYEFADGRRIIADGHQRLGLARRLSGNGVDIEMPVLVLREAEGITPQEARARAAFKNIAEGTGSASDAAKVLRDMGATPLDMGLPPKSALVRDAGGLVNLGDGTFGLVINKVISERDGAIIGRLINDILLQDGVAKLIAKLKPATAIETESIVRQAMNAGVSRGKQVSLFGETDIAESLYLERARVLDRGLRMIRRNVDTFRTLTERGDDITGAGNVLDKVSNAQRLNIERTLKEYITAQAHRKGVIGDALTKAAHQAKESGQYAKAAREFIEAVTRAAKRGEIDGDSLLANRLGSQSERQSGQTQSRIQEPTASQVVSDDTTLNKFDDPVGDASKQQASNLHQEITDEIELSSRKSEPGADGTRPLDVGLFGNERSKLDLLDVPIGERIDADGNRVAETKTVREVLNDLEEDQEFIEQLALCDGKAA